MLTRECYTIQLRGSRLILGGLFVGGPIKQVFRSPSSSSFLDFCLILKPAPARNIRVPVPESRNFRAGLTEIRANLKVLPVTALYEQIVTACLRLIAPRVTSDSSRCRQHSESIARDVCRTSGFASHSTDVAFDQLVKDLRSSLSSSSIRH